MKPFLAMLVGLAVTLVSSAQSTAQEPPPKDEEYQTIFFPTGAHDPREIASAVERIFAKRVTITPLMTHSVVAIRSAQQDRDEVMKVLKELTPQIHMLRLRLTLVRVNSPLSDDETARLSGPIPQVAKALDNLKRSEKLEFFQDVELTTLENQQAMIQMGGRIALSEGSIQIAGGRTTERYEWVEVGTIVTVVGKLDNEHLILELNYEKSFKSPSDPSDPSSEPAKTPTGISTLSHRSTLRIRDGHAQLVGSMSDSHGEDPTVVHLLVVAPEIL